MPGSSHEGKEWTKNQILNLNPVGILDIGVGSGTYSDLLRPHLPSSTFVGIEVFEPYVQMFNLSTKYHAVIIGDVREMDDLPFADVIILGDVLEHMHHDEAIKVWELARRSATKAVFLSLPIIEYPQGAYMGNHHETHLHTWSHEMVLSDLSGIIGSETYTEIGVYQAESLITGMSPVELMGDGE